ncbi:MAG: hypothetical protein QW676_00730 [Candidatus Aenigmatarchaeota archaeon]
MAELREINSVLKKIEFELNKPIDSLYLLKHELENELLRLKEIIKEEPYKKIINSSLSEILEFGYSNHLHDRLQRLYHLLGSYRTLKFYEIRYNVFSNLPWETIEHIDNNVEFFSKEKVEKYFNKLSKLKEDIENLATQIMQAAEIKRKKSTLKIILEVIWKMILKEELKQIQREERNKLLEYLYGLKKEETREFANFIEETKTRIDENNSLLPFTVLFPELEDFLIDAKRLTAHPAYQDLENYQKLFQYLLKFNESYRRFKKIFPTKPMLITEIKTEKPIEKIPASEIDKIPIVDKGTLKSISLKLSYGLTSGQPNSYFIEVLEKLNNTLFNLHPFLQDEPTRGKLKLITELSKMCYNLLNEQKLNERPREEIQEYLNDLLIRLHIF